MTMAKLPRLGPTTDKIELRARKFVADNPQVWDLFEGFVFELLQAGRKHYSADAIFHRIRWHVAVETRGDEFKMNDHYTSIFARWFILKYPEHHEFFETRVRGGWTSGRRAPDTQVG